MRNVCEFLGGRGDKNFLGSGNVALVVDMGWNSFSLSNIRYRNHNIDVEFTREKGMTVRVDGIVKANPVGLQKITIKSLSAVPGRR